jgi:hypothetical protein
MCASQSVALPFTVVTPWPRSTNTSILSRKVFFKENRRGKPLLILKLIKRKSTTMSSRNTKPKKVK